MGLLVKCFDEEHEQLLEAAMNEFLQSIPTATIIDVKFAVSHFEDTLDHEQVFSYASMIIYEEK